MTYDDMAWYAPQAPPPPRTRPGAQAYTRPHHTELASLRSAYRILRRVSTLTALGYFIVYVVLSCYAGDLMGARIAGELTFGIALGLIQLAVTFAAVRWYARSARRSVDPLALAIRQQSGDAEVRR